MTEHPYRTAETPPEQLMLERVRAIFESIKSNSAGKYVATRNHGIGTLTMVKEPSGTEEKKEETVIYTLTIGSPEKGLTVRILDRSMETQVQGFQGYEGANKKLNLRAAQEILEEIRTRQELDPDHAKTIGNNPDKRAELIRRIQKHGYPATHGIRANVTCDGITSVETYAPKNSPATITIEIEIEEQKKRLRFKINHEGEIVAAEKEKLRDGTEKGQRIFTESVEDSATEKSSSRAAKISMKLSTCSTGIWKLFSSRNAMKKRPKATLCKAARMGPKLRGEI
ncbi:MAG: hypothetical protein U0519_04815 [Candidatus Gracilibacteria bacterium]